MTDPPPPPNFSPQAGSGMGQGPRVGLVAIGLAVVVFFVFLWVESLTPTSPTSNSANGSTTDSDSSLACDHFHNVAYDAKHGLLTNDELRSKLQEVYENSSIATIQVRDAARHMLRAATAGDEQDLKVAVNEMESACRESGN